MHFNIAQGQPKRAQSLNLFGDRDTPRFAMASFYMSPEQEANKAFVLAAGSSVGKLEAAWANPERSFGVNDQWRSVAWNPATFNQTQAALHYAAQGGRSDSITWLLEHGANINILDSQCRTPLVVALQHEKWAAARKLLDEGAATAPVSQADGNGVQQVSRPAIMSAFGLSLRAVEMIRSVDDSGPRLEFSTAHERAAHDNSCSLLSCVSDCQDAQKQTRPKPTEVPQLLSLAAEHMSPLQHYQLSSMPLVLHSTLDAALVYLGGHPQGDPALAVPNSCIVREVCTGGLLEQRQRMHGSQLPVWVRTHHRTADRMLPLALVATWAHRCEAVHQVAHLCGLSRAPLHLLDAPLPSAACREGQWEGGLDWRPTPETSAPAATHERKEGAALDVPLVPLLCDVDASALLAAAAASQVWRGVGGVSDARQGEEGEVSTCAVTALLPCVMACALVAVRRLRVQSRQRTPAALRARTSLLFYIGEDTGQLQAQGRVSVVQAGAPQEEDELFRAHRDALATADVTGPMAMGPNGPEPELSRATVRVLSYARQQRRQLNPLETTPSGKSFAYCMSHSDLTMLVRDAGWQLRRKLLLLRRCRQRDSK